MRCPPVIAAMIAVLAGGPALAQPQADVFEVSPLETPGLARVSLALPDGAERLVTGAVEVLNCPDTGACSEIYPDTFYHACQPTPLAAPDGDGNFIYPFAGDTDPDDQLPEVMAFYQVHKALATAEALGLAGLGETLHVVVNYRQYDATSLADCGDGDYDGEVPLEPVDSAYFTTSGEGLAIDRTGFYLVLPQGHAIDHALDGDVVQHELGHAVMATLAPGLPRTLLDRLGTDPSPGGLHEGFADLLTLMVTGDPVIGAYAGSGKGDGGPLRDLREESRCPDDVVGEPHTDSRPFTSAVWSAREAISGGEPERAVAFDRAVMASWIALGERAGYQRAASLLVDAIEGELGAGAAGEAEQIFTDHGLTGCGGRVVDGAAGKPLAVLPGVADPERGGTAPAIFQLRLDLAHPASDISLEVAVLDTSAPELTDVTALLAPGEAPITWSTDDAGEPLSDAGLEVAVEVDAERHARAVFPGPFDSGTYHLMLVNHGPRAALYDTRAVAGDPTVDDGGCGCRTAGAPVSSAPLLLALGLMLGRARRRRALVVRCALTGPRTPSDEPRRREDAKIFFGFDTRSPEA